MGVQKIIHVSCDYAKCKGGLDKKSPAVLTWNETQANAGTSDPPEEAKYIVVINFGGKPLSFCCQLHAAEFFLPPGYEAVQGKLIEMPVQGKAEITPVTGQSEVCECGHPWGFHNQWGCTWVLSKEPGDFCKCALSGPKTEKEIA